MKKIIYSLLLVVIATACAENKIKEKPIVTVTLEPQRYFAEAIAGDKLEIVSMVPQGSSPETYDPSPRQMVALNQSVAYLRIGYIGFELTWMDRLTKNVPQLRVYDTSKGIDFIRLEEHHHEGHHHEGGIEPHIWNSARNASLIARNTLKALCEIDTANAVYYTQRFDSLNTVIHQTDSLVRQLMSNQNGSSFLIYHPALSYFARDYGLHQISIEEGGKEPSPTHLKELIELCHREKVRTIFVQQEFDRHNAELIAQETGTRVVSINPLSFDWEKEMLNIAKAFHHE